MRKLEVKSKWIANAAIDFIREGTMKGILACQLEFADAEGSFDDVASIIDQLLKAKMPPKRIVRLSGVLHPADSNLMLLVKSLYDFGFEVQAVIKDRWVFPWLQWVGWVIVRTSEHIVMTAADEVWLQVDELPKENVIIPFRKDRLTYCYVSGKLSKEDIDNFMCQSSIMWALL